MAHTLLLLLVLVAQSGCASYSERMARALQLVSGGAPAAGLGEINRAIGVGSDADLPERWDSNEALGVLERGVLLQSLGRFRESARDLEAAERELELLEFEFDGIGSLARYLYSDSAQKYRVPPSERLAVNVLNQLNYLAVGDLDGAAVEARRFQVAREYLESEGAKAPVAEALGAYLAGFTFEQLGEGDRALRYYEEALAERPLPSLAGPVASLARNYPYRGPALRAQLRRDPARAKRPGEGEILVIAALGRVPNKIPTRIPVGAALGRIGTLATGNLRVLQHSALKVLVYPELQPVPSGLGQPELRVDGAAVTLDEVANLGSAIRSEYDQLRPQILAAGLTRLAARAALAEGARRAGNEQSDALGIILGLATEAALVAADQPDTRSWSLLPARFVAARVRVPAGDHQIDLAFGNSQTLGAARSELVYVPPNGFATLIVVDPR